MAAQELQALARVDTQKSSIKDRFFGDLEITLELTQSIPYRVYVLDHPRRIVFDFKEAIWNSSEANLVEDSDYIDDIRFGVYRPNWTRMVLPLNAPLILKTVELKEDKRNGAARLLARFTQTTPEMFSQESRALNRVIWDENANPQELSPKTRQTGDGPLVVVIDPGHGGIDPGAVVDNIAEKDLVLQFAKELIEVLNRSGRFQAYLTRDDDSFLSLTGRISDARVKRADAFISLHADALVEGTASGITIYTLSDKASSEAAEQLAAQQDRSDLLSGVDLTQNDDEIAGTLMDLARVETNVRSRFLADHLVESITESIQQSRRRPSLVAGFTVLKAPDIPSVLIELGFITNKSDLANLQNEKWRRKVTEGIRTGLSAWAVDDAAQSQLIRQ